MVLVGESKVGWYCYCCLQGTILQKYVLVMCGIACVLLYKVRLSGLRVWTWYLCGLRDLYFICCDDSIHVNYMRWGIEEVVWSELSYVLIVYHDMLVRVHTVYGTDVFLVMLGVLENDGSLLVRNLSVHMLLILCMCILSKYLQEASQRHDMWGIDIGIVFMSFNSGPSYTFTTRSSV